MTRPVILFVLGAPGVGKTTLVRSLLKDPAREGNAELTFTEPPDPKWTIAGGTVAAGYYKGLTFDGADTVPYSGAAKALRYWNEVLADKARLTIFDGARFSNSNSLAYLQGAAEERGARIIGVHLLASADELQARRQERGSNQDPAWIKGATTGARNFAKKIDSIEIRGLDAFWTLQQVRQMIVDEGYGFTRVAA